MQAALKAAQKALPCPHPNPYVGSVLVYQNQVIESAFHAAAGQKHAERLVIEKAKRKGFKHFEKSDLYITLEPCCHTKKRTPPCLPLFEDLKLRNIFIAHKDPNPLVNGKSIRQLKRWGHRVHVGLLKKEAEYLNRAFLKTQRSSQPWVSLKLAMSLDGKIALPNGESKWITNPTARQYVQELRARHQAVGIGRFSLQKDQAQLTARMKSKTHARDIVIFGRPSKKEMDRLQKLHTNKLVIAQNKIETPSLFQQHKISSLLVEGGGQIATHLIQHNLVDEYFLFYAPKFFGGPCKYSVGENWNFKKIEQSPHIQITDVKKIGTDFLVHACKIND